MFIPAVFSKKFKLPVLGFQLSGFQVQTSHCCPCFAAGDVLGIGKILKNMVHMSNMFSHRIGTKGWSI